MNFSAQLFLHKTDIHYRFETCKKDSLNEIILMFSRFVFIRRKIKKERKINKCQSLRRMNIEINDCGKYEYSFKQEKISFKRRSF